MTGNAREGVNCYSLVRFTLAFVALAVAFSPLSSALPQVHGFRASWLTVNPNGVTFNDSGYNMTVGVYANNSLIPASYFGGDVYFNRVIVNDAYYPNASFANGSWVGYWVNSTSVASGYSWNVSLNVTQSELNSYAGGSLSFRFNTTSPIIPEGAGSFEVLAGSIPCVNEYGQAVSCSEFDVWNNGDLVAAAARYGLIPSESYYSQSINNVLYYFYQLSFSNITSYGPVGEYYFDPTISTFNSSNFGNGVFNNTYTNDSQSVFTTYYANNESFLGSGSYFSQAFVLNHTYPNVVNSINWAWFEAGGFYSGGNDSPVMDLHFENDLKDDSRYNQSLSWVGPANFTPGFIGSGVFLNTSVSNLTSVVNFTSLPFGDSPRSINFWWKMPVSTNTTSQGYAVLSYGLPKGNNAGESFVVRIYGSTSGAQLSIFGDNADSFSGTLLSILDGNWHELTATYYPNSSAQTWSYYVDGVFYANNSVNHPLNTPSGTILTMGGDNLNGFDGSSTMPFWIDELSFYNRTLSQSEVSQLYSWESQGAFIHNFTNVTLNLRDKNYTFNDSSLVGWWDLGDSSGNESAALESLDLSGNGNTLAYIGNSSLNAPGASFPVVNTTNAVIGNSVTLNGNNSYLTANDAGFEYAGGNMTMSAWFYLNSNAHSQYLITKPWNDDGQYDYQLYVNSGGGLYAQVFANTTFTARNNTAVSLNAWHQGALALYSNGSMVVYLDGNAISQNVTPGSSGNWTPGDGNQTKNLTIGTDYPYGTVGNVGMVNLTLNGSMDDVKIWNRTLSPTEISALYNNGNPTGSNGEESNWSGWQSPGYSGGSSAVSGVEGNLVQYRANFSSSSANYSGFLQNVSFNEQTIFAQVSSALVAPSSGSNVSGVPYLSGNVSFSYFPNSSTGAFGNASLWSNWKGSWSLNATVSAGLSNGSVNLINGTNVPQGDWLWNVQVCSQTGSCVFATQNYTVDVDITNPFAPKLVSPANGTNQTGFTVNFTFIPSDAFTGAANTTFWVVTGGSIVNSTANLTITNGSQVTNEIVLQNQGVYNWTVQTCDWANNCVNTTFGNFTIQNTGPLPTTLISPLNYSNQSSLTVNFSFIPADAYTGAANTTFWVFNSSGKVVNSTTNTSVTNGSQVSSLVFMTKQGIYNWTVQDCNWVGLCSNTSFGNFTIDNTNPLPAVLVSPVNGTNQSSLTLNFTYVPSDAFTGAANTTLYVVNSNGTMTNVVVNVTVVNGSQVTDLVTVPSQNLYATYNWTVETCDWANNCVNTTFGNVTVDNFSVPPMLSNTVPQPMTVYGYFTGALPNSIVNVTAYIGGNFKGVFPVSTLGQYGLFDVQGNYTDYGQVLHLYANGSASFANTTVYTPGNTTLIYLPS